MHSSIFSVGKRRLQETPWLVQSLTVDERQSHEEKANLVSGISCPTMATFLPPKFKPNNGRKW